MSLKRKVESISQDDTLEDLGLGLTGNHLPFDREINGEDDSTDEELSDVDEDIDNDFDQLNLDTDSEGEEEENINASKEENESGDEEEGNESGTDLEVNESGDEEEGNESGDEEWDESGDDEWDESGDEEENGSSEVDGVSGDEWEDVESKDEVQSCDSAYVGSSAEDTKELKKKSYSLKTKSSKTLKNVSTESLNSEASTSKQEVSINKVNVKSSRKKTLTKSKAKPNLVKSKEKHETTERVNPKTDSKESSSTYNEYEEDSSDEEELRNTIGNIPINWYDEYDHLGYGLDSLPILKPKKTDTLEKFLEKMENPDFNRTVFDKQTGQNVVLSDSHVDLIQRVMKHQVPNAAFNLYEPFPDLYSHEVMQMPLSGRPEPKLSFLPVKSDREKVAKMAILIRQGLMKRRKKPPNTEQLYDLWKPRSEEEAKLMKIRDHIPAPKELLPGHRDSFNPPPEYLVSYDDMQGLKYKEDQEEGEKPMFSGFWRKFSSIREIPSYPKAVKARMDRLLDLYLAPRKRIVKITAASKDFLPDLPNKKDLRPYPTVVGLTFKGHQSIIRTISVHPNGKFLASGSDDHTIRVWEINTGRCLRTFEVEHTVRLVSWNPNSKLFLLAFAMENKVVLLNPETYLTDKIVVEQTNAIFKEEVDQGDYIAPKRVMAAVTWRKATPEEWAKGYRVVLDHFKAVKEVKWHRQGDYFASVMPEGIHRSVLLHQLSRWRSHQPFQKNKGRVETVAFHPKQPQFFVVTQTHIRVYDLKRQSLLKKIQSNSRWISSIAVHPGGEHFVIGGYDRRINWFEMECTKRPHLMRYHSKAVRSVNFHRKYPLYATCSDDGNIIVTHGTVYDDWLKDPLIVPLKRLKGHQKFDDLVALDLAWHPHEPFLFSAGADATIKLWH